MFAIIGGFCILQIKKIPCDFFHLLADANMILFTIHHTSLKYQWSRMIRLSCNSTRYKDNHCLQHLQDSLVFAADSEFLFGKTLGMHGVGHIQSECILLLVMHV
jgi:hypothetical protein